jgi:HSP20 family protein
MNSIVKRFVYFPRIFTRFWNDDFLGKVADENLSAANVTDGPKAFEIALSLPGFVRADVQVSVSRMC